MNQPINFDKVADIYDYYVNTDFDIPFFLRESEGYRGEILEVMCGTGRVSLPLLESGRKMTCVDYSKKMLESFNKKIHGREYLVNLVEMDVTTLHLDRKFGMIIMPFHSFSEILTAELQQRALCAISSHLERGGLFILTLQNPKTRIKSADGHLRLMGKYTIDRERQMIISYMNQFDMDSHLVNGFQFYEIYDNNNILIEKRFLKINFRPVTDAEIRYMAADCGLAITNVYGDYTYRPFDEQTSGYMIYKITKK